jgi:enoyl-CoA hydratase/carnithine racemase
VGYQEILWEVNNHIARITLNRPEKKNALSRGSMAELTDALERARDYHDVHLLIITGAGEEAFCSGADINDFLGKDIQGKREQNEAYRRICEAFMNVGKPVIGAVNGLALGGGCGLTLLCDFVIASEKARFGFPEIRAGIFPMMVMANLFRVIARRKALELVMTGQIIDALEAERIGLINRVVPHQELGAHVDKLSSDLLELSACALRLGKEAFYGASEMSARQALNYLMEMATIMLLTEDAKEGLEAFLAKRKPSWKGR